MDYRSLLDVTTEIGYQLAMSGAETFRVEETVTRIFSAYHIQAEVFAIPQCLIVSLETDKQEPMTRMRRIINPNTNLDAVERFSNLSRKICSEKPDPAIALQWVQDTHTLSYPFWIQLLGAILAASGFIMVFGGSISDTICTCLCGFFIGLITQSFNKWKVNRFFSTIISAFFIAFIAYLYGILSFATNVDGIIMSSLMVLVPGLLFTNAMRDIIYGDTNSGINRIVQVLLVGVGIALGTGAAWSCLLPFGSNHISKTTIIHPIWLESVTILVACIGFCISFNIHGKGAVLCALGGAVTWALFQICQVLEINTITAFFIASLFSAIYSEIMARIRKYPAISYLVVSIIPLLPGAGIYKTTTSVLEGDMAGFISNAIQTIAIAGAIAVGILIVSTMARLLSNMPHKK